VVQALGNAFGSLQTPPYGLLDGDGRSGAATAGENLLVNLDQLQQIRRILVFAYSYQGTPAWDPRPSSRHQVPGRRLAGRDQARYDLQCPHW